nr:hypothetical protein [Tanacetum cinerariifolium]
MPSFPSPEPKGKLVSKNGYDILEIVHDFEDRLETIIRRQVNRVRVLDFKRLTPEMRQDLAERLWMVYTRDDGHDIFLGGARRSMTWRQFILALGLHTTEEIAEDGFDAYWFGTAHSYTYIRDPVQRSCLRLISYNISRRGQASEEVTSTDLFYPRSMDRRETNVLYLLAQYLFWHAEGRKSDARLRGLFVVTRELPLIDMGELVKVNIRMEVGDDWVG